MSPLLVLSAVMCVTVAAALVVSVAWALYHPQRSAPRRRRDGRPLSRRERAAWKALAAQLDGDDRAPRRGGGGRG